MPEDENPALDKSSEENYLYFTLPMALNYQRDSYKLWAAAHETFKDAETRMVFNPRAVVRMNTLELREKLVRHKVALQPNKHIEIWQTLCRTFAQNPIKNLFEQNDSDVVRLKTHIPKNKKDFPYLSGPKILNYWLYVMEQYTDLTLQNRQSITIAPDTHVIQASVRLGLLNQSETTRSDVRDYVSSLWHNLLRGQPVMPIDIHTPLWLWSRNGFQFDVSSGGTHDKKYHL